MGLPLIVFYIIPIPRFLSDADGFLPRRVGVGRGGPACGYFVTSHFIERQSSFGQRRGFLPLRGHQVCSHIWQQNFAITSVVSAMTTGVSTYGHQLSSTIVTRLQSSHTFVVENQRKIRTFNEGGNASGYCGRNEKAELGVDHFRIELAHRSMTPAENSLLVRSGFAQVELAAIVRDADHVLLLGGLE